VSAVTVRAGASEERGRNGQAQTPVVASLPAVAADTRRDGGLTQTPVAATGPSATAPESRRVAWHEQPGRIAKVAWTHPAEMTVALAAMGAIGYGWAYALCAVFYAELGVSPQVLNLSYAGLLANAFLGITLLLAFDLTVVVSLYGLARLLARLNALLGGAFARGRRSLRRRWRTWLLGALVAIGGAAVAVIEVGPVAVLTLELFVLLVALVVGMGSVNLDGVAPRIIVKALAAIIALTVVVTSFAFARGEALGVRNKGAVDFHLLSALYPWQARQATVVTGGKVTIPCVIYLGQTSGGPLVLGSDPRGHRTAFVVSSNDAMVFILPTGYGCGKTWPKVR
jgi:hypothetical protein